MTARAQLLSVLAATLLLLPACAASIGQRLAESRPRFSFVVLADPHLNGKPKHDGRLRACMQWINEHREAEGIDLVFVVGDLGVRFELAPDLLDELDVPWVPIIGDNSVQSGRETEFAEVFEPQYRKLAGLLAGWRKAPTPVPAPGTARERHLVNFSFDHKGAHFVGLDWCERGKGKLRGEQADLHAIPGGTLPFLRGDLERCTKTRCENVVLLSHHPMHSLLFGVASFSPSEMRRIQRTTRPYADHVYAAFSGHYHHSMKDRENSGGFEVYVTAAAHDAKSPLRLVRVNDDGTAFTYDHRLVEARK